MSMKEKNKKKGIAPFGYFDFAGAFDKMAKA
jgi:hypothetical protein